MSVEILGELRKPLGEVVRVVLRRALDPRPQHFLVHISWPHAELVVHIREPFDRRLKFNRPMESDLARELYATVTAIADERFGTLCIPDEE